VGEELRIAASVEVDVLVDVDDFLGRIGRKRCGESGKGREAREAGEVSAVHQESMMKRSPADGEENGSTIARHRPRTAAGESHNDRKSADQLSLR